MAYIVIVKHSDLGDDWGATSRTGTPDSEIDAAEARARKALEDAQKRLDKLAEERERSRQVRKKNGVIEL